MRKANVTSQYAGVKGKLPGLLVFALLFAAPHDAATQDVPIVSGAVGFFHSTTGGRHVYQPVIAPVVVAPLGNHLLMEARFDLRGFISRNGANGPYTGSYFGSTQYLQLDYIPTPKLTVTVGRFLTPFGTYNERQGAIWIQRLQDAPLIFAIGTRTTASSDGVMVRGALLSEPEIHVNYVSYFSASSGVTQFEAARAAGGRLDVYLPEQRVEIGASYARFLQGTHNNSVGAHFWWQPKWSPLQVRSEYAHGEHAQGYWVESAYRLSQLGGSESVAGRLEPVFRIQQTFRNSPGAGDGLPSVDTKQTDFGFDYHFQHEVRLNTSYSRKFAPTGNANIWEASLTYRFLFPLWRGHK